MPFYFDYGIIGAGFAGLSLADALQEADQNVIVIEKDESGSGASGTPGALVNPATGRKGKKSWRAEKCYKAVRKNLEKIQNQASFSFFQKNGVLRPAQTEKMARKMKEQFEKTVWPDGWCYWLTEKEIEYRHPGIHCTGGGLWLPKALTVNGRKYLKAYSHWLKNKDVKIKTHCSAEVEQKNDHWAVYSDNFTIKCEKIVDATGYRVIKTHFWQDIKLEPIKGQLAEFQSKNKLDFTHSVSGLGYIANGSSDDSFIQGSTYEHNFEDLQTDKEGADYLKKRLKRMLPELAEEVKLISQWSGVRISAPNRKPVVGEHPRYQNLYLFTGLGSKGLLYGKFTAEHFANHLMKDAPLYNEIDIQKLY